LLNEGIQLALTSRGDMDLGVCVVLVDDSGERTFITSPGAELTLRADELATLALVGGDIVYVSGYNVVYPEVADTVSQWLRTLPSDVVVAFDPGPRVADIAPHVLARVLERTDWFLCNTAEARLMCTGTDAADFARQLREREGFERVVVRDGAQGCASASEDGLWRAPGFETHVVDTNGAGDVHNGVVIAELMMGTALDEALLRANAAASIAIASFGPATCPTRNLVDAKLSAKPRGVTRL
jgi:sugar/nucleoside kinase (ribokinase family)